MKSQKHPQFQHFRVNLIAVNFPTIIAATFLSRKHQINTSKIKPEQIHSSQNCWKHYPHYDVNNTDVIKNIDVMSVTYLHSYPALITPINLRSSCHLNISM